MYLAGTIDPGHGKATIAVDDGEPVTVDTSGKERATGQIWFSSGDLEDGAHTLTLYADTKAIGIEAAYVINNDGVGMIGLEADEFTMNEDETLNVKVIRVGGTNGPVKAYLSPNPGSAIQDDFYTEPAVVTLADGESETTVPVITRRNTNRTGTQDFTIELNSPSSGLIIGLIDTATVNILDAESMTKEQLQKLADSVDGWSRTVYAGDWTAFENALAYVKALLAQESPDALAMGRAYAALQNAKDNLKERTQFTEEDPVVFPTKQSQTVRAEAEQLELDDTDAAAGKEIRVVDKSTGSNGKHVGWFENGNSMKMHYYAAQEGTYTVTLTYACGRPERNKNNLTFTGDKLETSVTEEFMQKDPNDWGTVWQTREFDIKITEAGEGTINITTTNGGPNLDKFEIVPKDIVYVYDISASATKGGRAELSEKQVLQGEDVEVTITPDYGYTLTSLAVNGSEVSGFHKHNIDYSISNITEDKTITAAFEKTGYTEGEPFAFPTEGNTAVLEAEDFTLFNVNGNTEQWKLGIINGRTSGWEGGATYINSFDPGDYISVPYTAEAGTYDVAVRYSSGSTENKLVWSSDGTIKDGQASAGNGNASEFVTAEFEVTVTESGSGIWTFTSPAAGKSPRIDKFEITSRDTVPEPAEKYSVAATVEGGHGTVSADPQEVTAGEDAAVTFVPDEGYAVGTVKVNDAEVRTEGNSYLISDIREDQKVVATYDFDYYTEKEPFHFPAAAGASETVQAEHFILYDNNDGEEPIREDKAEWADGGKFVNWFNAGDSIVLNYYAEKAGKYKFTMRYQSGSPANGISWSGDKIEPGSLDGVTADPFTRLQPRTADFSVNVTEAGSGQLIIKSGQAKAPQVDRFIVELADEKGTVAPVDKVKLDEQIKKAEAEAAKTDVFTPESIEFLNTTIEAAREVLESEAAEQEDVNERIALLQEAVANLVRLPETFEVTAAAGADGKIELTGSAQDGTVEKGKNVTYTVTADEGFVIDTLTVDGQEVAEASGQKSYTGTVSNVQAAVEVKAVFAEKAVQPDPEEPKEPDPEEAEGSAKEELSDAIQDAKKLLEQTDKYTAESLEAYRAVVDDAILVFDSENTAADDITKAIKLLEDGKLLLEEKKSDTENPDQDGQGEPDKTPAEGAEDTDEASADSPEDTDEASADGQDNSNQSGQDKAASGGKAKPSAGSDKTRSDKEKLSSAQTGDGTDITVWVIVLAASVSAGAGVLVLRKKNKK